MLRQKVKHAILGTASIGALVCGLSMPASAAIINAWQFNLAAANGTYDNGVALAGLTSTTNIDHIEVSGHSTVLQSLNVANGSPIGQTFTDSGFLQLTGYKPEPGGGIALPLGTDGANNVLYFQFTGLTGVFNTDGTITFAPSVGKVKLFLDGDGNTDPTSSAGLSKLLATFDMVAPSGGSNLNFFGGANPTGTIDVTLKETSGVANLYKDSSGATLPLTLTLHLVNVNALTDPNFNPNPSFSGPGVCNASSGGAGCNLATLNVQNAGQYNLATPVPEPGTLSLLGAGLLLLGFGVRRRKAD